MRVYKRLSICLYVCKFLRVWVCAYVYMFEYLRIYKCICMHVYVCNRKVYRRLRVCEGARVSVCIYACVYVPCVCVRYWNWMHFCNRQYSFLVWVAAQACSQLNMLYSHDDIRNAVSVCCLTAGTLITLLLVQLHVPDKSVSRCLSGGVCSRFMLFTLLLALQAALNKAQLCTPRVAF